MTYVCNILDLFLREVVEKPDYYIFKFNFMDSYYMMKDEAS